MRFVVPCPAKINTFLSVGPIDSRGYHPLRTIFQAVGLFDTLTVKVLDRGKTTAITSDWAELPFDNTLTKTLRLLQEVITLPPLSIHLEKRIPAQSGLGGGSGDAAGLIRAVDKITRNSIPQGELKAIAAAVGADVPFFLVGGRARGEGYGQRLKPMPDEQERWLIVARPRGVTCSTREMFEKLDAQEREWRSFDNDESIHNDFLEVAPRECRDLIETLSRAGGQDVGLTGSGSACFAFFPDEHAANEAAAGIENPHWVARTLSREESLAIHSYTP